MALFRQIGPTLDPKVADALADFDKLRSKRRPSRSERQRISEFRKIVLGRSDELREQPRGMMVQAGADELTPGFRSTKRMMGGTCQCANHGLIRARALDLRCCAPDAS